MKKANFKMVWIAALSVFWLGMPRGQCSTVYQFTGEVTSIGKDTITVRRGDEEAKFSRPKDMGSVHPGDRVTVYYGMETRKVRPAREAAGTTPPNQHLILDDRAFYNAKNQSRPKEKNPG